MNVLHKTTIAALLVLGAAGASHAQGLNNPLLPTTGTREIAVRGSLFFNPNDTYNLQGKYGPFVTDRLQLAGTLGYDKSGSVKTTVYGAEANYHFPNASATLPFVGAFLGGTNIGGAPGGKTNTTAYGVQGGVKQFLSNDVAATAELQHRRPQGAARNSTTGIVFGLAFYR